jgi:ABC-type transport system involved in cytochrome c biogenesis permease subunit
MNRLRTAGASWIAAAIFAIAITVIFRDDVGQIMATAGLAVATSIFGLWMLGRAEPVPTPVAVVVGACWLVLYGGLALLQADEVEAWVTDVFLAVVGVGVALLPWALRSRGSDAGKPAREGR